MKRPVPFTKAQINRAVAGTTDAGLRVRGVRVYPDGSIEVLVGDAPFVPVDSPKATLAASWDDA